MLGNDLITDFFQYASTTQDDRSPELFRKWCGIALVAGAMERKITVKTGMNTTFCNLYTLLVAPSGTGKYIINTVRDLWGEVKDPLTGGKAFWVASDALTKAALVDELGDSHQTKLNGDGEYVTYHSLLVGAEEFGILLSAYDMEFISTINGIWNCPPSHREKRRTSVVKLIDIEKPQLNILGGVQPSFLANVFPDQVWTTGLARRIILIFSNEKRIRDPFTEYPAPSGLRSSILARLGEVSTLWGTLEWTPKAKEYFQGWVLSGEPPVPQHSRLIPYVSERARLVQKLVGISSVSRKIDLSPIEMVDIDRSLEWLFEIENKMPEIFRAMIAKSDWAIVEELYHWLISVWNKNGKKHIAGEKIIGFIGERTTAEKVNHCLGLAVRTRAIECVDQGSDLWRPLSKQFRTTE